MKQHDQEFVTVGTNKPRKNIKYVRQLIIPGIITAIFLSVVFGGFYNVGATNKHSKPVEWVLRTTMENSVRKNAASIKVPDSIKFGDSLYYREFYGHYSAACQPCHGAPGKNRAPWMVIYPESPDLTDKVIVGNWSDAELYWIIKHGIKNTGMMALGPTHPDEAVWGVTAFVKKLPEMTPEEYQSIAAWFEKTKGKM